MQTDFNENNLDPTILYSSLSFESFLSFHSSMFLNIHDWQENDLLRLKSWKANINKVLHIEPSKQFPTYFVPVPVLQE